MNHLLTLPIEIADGLSHMATDRALLEWTGEEPAVYFRHYTWKRAEYTFGYTQKWNEIAPYAVGTPVTRRPTGGGLVYHDQEYTYAVVFPCSHPMYQKTASESYNQIHQLVQKGLERCGFHCSLTPCLRKCETSASHQTSAEHQGRKNQNTNEHSPAPQVCFQNPVPYDVVESTHGSKIAGAAQKRTREGLLIQGSVSFKPFLPSFQIETWHDAFLKEIETFFQTSSRQIPMPDAINANILKWRQAYQQNAWLKKR